MLTINDNDLPIAAAGKIISGTKEANNCDMFTNEEIKEIADYLMVYYNSHKEGNDE